MHKHNTTKVTLSGDVEVGVLQEDGLPTIAYANLGGVLVYLSEREDGTVRVNLEPHIKGTIKVEVYTNDRDKVADVRFD